jgi:hypothetical protein
MAYEVQKSSSRAGPIEASDADGEVERLEELGAKRVHKVQTGWLMEAPAGQRFCVVQASLSRFRIVARASGVRLGDATVICCTNVTQ